MGVGRGWDGGVGNTLSPGLPAGLRGLCLSVTGSLERLQVRGEGGGKGDMEGLVGLWVFMQLPEG